MWHEHVNNNRCSRGEGPGASQVHLWLSALLHSPPPPPPVGLDAAAWCSLRAWRARQALMTAPPRTPLWTTCTRCTDASSNRCGTTVAPLLAWLIRHAFSGVCACVCACECVHACVCALRGAEHRGGLGGLMQGGEEVGWRVRHVRCPAARGEDLAPATATCWLAYTACCPNRSTWTHDNMLYACILCAL